MADQLALDLVGQRLVTDQLTLTVGYDIDNERIGKAVPVGVTGPLFSIFME